jgi:Flp pilus assembly protein protease CpaA
MRNLEQITEWLPGLIVLVAVTAGAVIDFRHFRLPNRLTFPLILSGIIWHTAAGGVSGLALTLIGLTMAALPPLLMFLKGGMGAGDVKLMAGIGAWMGWEFSMYVLIAAGLLGGVCGILFRFFRSGVSETLPALHSAKSNSAELTAGHQLDDQEAPEDLIRAALNSPAGRSQLLPFGVMIALGTLLLIAIDPQSF